MKSDFRYSIIIFLLTFLISVQQSYGQCCSAGSPLGASTYGGIVQKNSIRMSTYVRYSQSDDYYTGTKKTITGNEPVSYADFLFQGLTLAFGITKKMNVEAEHGYFYHKRQYYPKDPLDPLLPQTIIKGNGLSNGIISVKYALYKSMSKAFELTLGAGLKFPFSSKPQYEDNAILPIDVQPSTNAYGWMGQMILQKEFKPQKITLFLFNRYEQNFVNDNDYKYGERMRVSLIASKNIKKYYGVIVQARYEYIGNDVRNGAKDANTGANLIFVSPQFLYSLKSKWNFIVGVDLPVYKNYNGFQMSNNYALSLSINRDISLNKNPKAEEVK